MDKLKDKCTCGHEQGDHTGAGICVKCDTCKAFTKAPDKREEKAHQFAVKSFAAIKECATKIQLAYGNKGIEGYNCAINLIMNTESHPAHIAMFIASNAFDEVCNSVEARMGFLTGVKMGMMLRERMEYARRGMIDEAKDFNIEYNYVTK